MQTLWKHRQFSTKDTKLYTYMYISLTYIITSYCHPSKCQWFDPSCFEMWTFVEFILSTILKVCNCPKSSDFRKAISRNRHRNHIWIWKPSVTILSSIQRTGCIKWLPRSATAVLLVSEMVAVNMQTNGTQERIHNIGIITNTQFYYFSTLYGHSR